MNEEHFDILILIHSWIFVFCAGYSLFIIHLKFPAQSQSKIARAVSQFPKNSQVIYEIIPASGENGKQTV